MEYVERADNSLLPAGYGRVYSGEILPADLVWCWTTKEWLRHDDPGWNPVKSLRAENAIGVARSGRASTAMYANRRTYSIHRAPVEPPDLFPEEPPEMKAQTSLFEEFDW